MDRLKNLLKRYNWEFMLLIVLIAINIMNRSLSPYYDIANLADATNSFLDRGLIALSMTFVILTGMIDISVASTVALSSVVMAVSYNGGVPMPIAVVICLAVGLACGMINGLLLTRFKELASMIVTLSTQIIYRGIALIILGDQASGKFPKWFKVLGWNAFLGLPVMAWAFLIFFIAFAFVLHKTRYGRALYAIGMNPTVARFSGIDVDRAVFLNFALNGLMAGVMALFLTSRTGSSRPNIAVGYEMDIIAMVVLGGVSAAGGKGRMFGVLISIFIVGLIRYGLGLININQQILMIVIGLLLIVSVALPEIRTIVERRRHEKKVAGSAQTR